jgi:hypothetical protein
VALRLFIFLSCVFLLVTSREPPWADSHVTYDTTENLVEHAALDTHLDSGPPWFYARRDGHKYGVFPLGNVLAMVPSYLAYKALRHLPGVPDRPLYAMICHFAPALMMAAACALFFLLVRRRGARPRVAVFATLMLGLGTIVLIYARSPYAEAVQTLALTWLCERTLSQGRRPTVTGLGWLGVAAGVLINTKLVYVLVLPLSAAFLVYQRRRARNLVGLLAACPLGILAFLELVALALWHNHLKTGSLFDTGYQIKQGVFSGDLLPALYGFILSTGKGMFYYSPPLILAVLGVGTALKRHRVESIFLLSVIAVVLVFNSKFRAWHADYCWGPRYLTPVTPIFLSLMFPWFSEMLERGWVRARRSAVAALLVAGVGVQILGASIYWDHYIRVLIALKDQTNAAGWFQDALSHGHYVPLFSPLRGHAWLLSHALRNDPELDADAPWKALVPQGATYDDAWGRLRVDWWPLEWLNNPEPVAPGIAGRPGKLSPPAPPPSAVPATCAALLVLLGAVVASGRSLVRRLPRATARLSADTATRAA